MPTYYVSNEATNGYVVGNDGNSGLTQALAKLTINAAHTAASNGDTIIVNPTATPYVETSGAGYLSITKGITVQGDYTYSGQPELRFSTNGRVLNLNQTVTFQNFVINSQSFGATAVTLQPQTTVCKDLVFKNIATGSFGALSAGTSGTQNHTVEKCTLLASNGNGVGVTLFLMSTGGAAAQVKIKGCTVNGCHSLFKNISSGSSLLIQTALAADGTRNTVTSCTTGVVLPTGGTHAQVDLQYIDFVTMTDASLGYSIYDSTSATVSTIFNVKNCTYTGSQGRFIFLIGTVGSGVISNNTDTSTGSHSFVDVRNVLVTNLKVHTNTTVLTSGSTDSIRLSSVGTGVEVYNNTCTSDITSGRIIGIGGDGQLFKSYNTAASTGQSNLGDVAGKKYTFMRFQADVSASQFNQRAVCCARAFMRKVGTPTGTVTAKLYTDAAGAPGTLLDTSDFALTGALLTSSQFVEFTFPTRVLQTYAAFYHIQFEFTGTIDGANYFQFDYNAAVGTTGMFASGYSADGAAWTTDAARAYRAGVGVVLGADCTNPLIYSNVVRDENAALTLPHCVILNGTEGGKVYRNQVYGGGIGILTKLVKGDVTTCIVYDNLISFTLGGANAGQGIRDKGSKTPRFYHNTVSVNGCAAKCANVDADYIASGDTYFPGIGGTKCTNAEFKNNILVRNGGAQAGYIYEIGFSVGANSVTGLVINNNVPYVGTNTTMATNGTSGSAVDNNQATWQGNGFDVNSVFTNPSLSSSAPTISTGFYPSQTSPAKNMGASLVTYVTQDFLSEYFDAVPDAGAFDIGTLYSVNFGKIILVINTGDLVAVKSKTAGFRI